MPSIPRTIGRFEIRELYKKGGMGEIFLAEDSGSGEEVVIKVLSPEAMEREYVSARFLQEIEIYKMLSHPNIVRYIDSGEHDGRPYIVLEWIRGRNLKDLLDENGPLSLNQALSLMLDVLYAVNYAHSRQIIHRDLKPQNIMVSNDGVIKIIDFGVAHARKSLVNTSAGMVIGSLCYNSPEQNQGRFIDYRSDIYSLGLVFYETLTGKRLLPNTSISDIIFAQAELDRTIEPPSKLNPEVPGLIDDMILRMCRFNPDERHPSVEHVIVQLQNIISQLGLSIDTVSPDTVKAKSLAMRDLADTHYWRGMNYLAEMKYLEALREFEALLCLSFSYNKDYRERVEEQLNFLSWSLDVCCEGTSSTEEELKALEIEVLQKLSDIYARNAQEKKSGGIRKAMAELLAMYKQRLADIHSRRKAQWKNSRLPISYRDYPRIMQKLSSLYSKLGLGAQKKLVEDKLVRFLSRRADPSEADQIFSRILEEYPDDVKFRRAYCELLERQGRREEEKVQRLLLAARLMDQEQYASALEEYDRVLAAHPDCAEAGEGKERVRKHLDEVSRETERLIELTRKMEEIDINSAVNLCRKFLNDYPENLQVLDKLASLHLLKGEEEEAVECLLRLGVSSFEREDYERARDYFVRVLTMRGDCKQALNFLVEIVKMEDPSITELGSHKAVIDEVLVRVGLASLVIERLRRRLKGRLSDVEVLARVRETALRGELEEEAVSAWVDAIGLYIRHDQLDEARREVVSFLERWPEYAHRLVPLADLPRTIKDPVLKEMLKSGTVPEEERPGEGDVR